MRNRHFPRLCGSCRAPMGRQEDTCWHCGARWRSEERSATRLHLIAGDVPGGVAGALGHVFAADVAAGARAETPARADLDRWTGEGGSVDREEDALVVAATTRT
jgi:hypothetical protein